MGQQINVLIAGIKGQIPTDFVDLSRPVVTEKLSETN